MKYRCSGFRRKANSEPCSNARQKLDERFWVVRSIDRSERRRHRADANSVKLNKRQRDASVSVWIVKCENEYNANKKTHSSLLTADRNGKEPKKKKTNRLWNNNNNESGEKNGESNDKNNKVEETRVRFANNESGWKTEGRNGRAKEGRWDDEWKRADYWDGSGKACL